MTTKVNDHVVVEATGLVRICSYCVPRVRRADLHRAHRVTDSICPSCLATLFASMDTPAVQDVERLIEESARERRAA